MRGTGAGRGFEHDVMLYAFLLDSDPAAVTLEAQAQRRLDLKLGASPEQRADISLELWQQLAPAIFGSVRHEACIWPLVSRRVASQPWR